jgi:hypothetical protein
MYEMDGAAIVVGDAVHDTLYGVGRVVELLPTNRFRVNFPSKPHGLVYDVNGVGVRYTRRTLFWHDPVIATPPKDSRIWLLLRPIITGLIADTLRAFGGRIV